MARGNIINCKKPKKMINSAKKRFRLVAVVRKYQGSKIIGMFYMLMHSYIFQKYTWTELLRSCVILSH